MYMPNEWGDKRSSYGLRSKRFGILLHLVFMKGVNMKKRKAICILIAILIVGTSLITACSGSGKTNSAAAENQAEEAPDQAAGTEAAEQQIETEAAEKQTETEAVEQQTESVADEKDKPSTDAQDEAPAETADENSAAEKDADSLKISETAIYNYSFLKFNSASVTAMLDNSSENTVFNNIMILCTPYDADGNAISEEIKADTDATLLPGETIPVIIDVNKFDPDKTVDHVDVAVSKCDSETVEEYEYKYNLSMENGTLSARILAKDMSITSYEMVEGYKGEEPNDKAHSKLECSLTNDGEEADTVIVIGVLYDAEGNIILSEKCKVDDVPGYDTKDFTMQIDAPGFAPVEGYDHADFYIIRWI